MPRTRRRLTTALAAACLLLSGCYGVSHNPSSFPYLLPFGDIVRTHAKPPGLGYYANFDPHAVRVEVRPLESVSPVRQQYVLVATVYDDKGTPRRNRRVEWLLEGAGNILEVDESGFFPGRGYKVDNHYAVSYTNYAEHRMTRGNSDPKDDFVLRPGQSWCVITSAVEGDTHVTVYCPEVHDWQHNKVITTTHWVDAEWAFPRPAAARTGTQHVLTTNVVRSSDKQPLAGYRVRYRLLDGPPAVFVPGGAEAVAVSDLRGNASVALAQAQPGAGPNRVAVEVIRAPDPSKSSDAGLVLARGETTVDWQAPVVSLDVTAPPSVILGQELPYSISLTNSGQVETKALTVRSAIPEGLEAVRSEPPASAEGKELVWTLGEVPGKQTRLLQAVFRAARLGPVTNRVSVTTAEGLRGEKTITSEVTPQPRAALKVTVSAPATAALDGPTTYLITVSNPGTGAATNVVLNVALGDGLAHESKANPIEASLGKIEPGTNNSVPLTLTAKAVGPQVVRVTARGDNGLKDSAEHTLTVRRSALTLENKGPSWRYASRPATWTVQVKNAGEVALANVAVRYALPPELEFKSAGAGGTLQGREVVWVVGELGPEQQKDLEVTATCRALAEKAVTVATATAERGLRVEAKAEIQVRGLPAVRMRVVDAADPVEVGGRTEYRIEVTNSGTLPGTDIKVVADVPKEMKVLAPSGPTAGKVEGQRVTFAPLPSLEPGQTVTFAVPVEALAPGVVYFHAELSGAALSRPVVEEESTTILPAPGGN